MKAVLVTLVCYAMFTLYSTTVLATVYKWNPASGSSAKNKANWRTSCGTSGTVFPASGDTLEFNGSCSDANCVLDTTFNVAMINVKSSYSGDITVSGSIALTFAEGIFLGGTFNGGSIPITFTESLRINGNAFTSTSAILSIAGDFTYNGSSFTHNSGTVLFKKGSATTTVFSGTSNGGTSLTLYKAEFAATAANTQFMIRNITVHVLNEMKLSGTYQLFLNTNTSSTVEVQGNIISSNTASVGGGTVLLLVNGTGAQTINDNQGTSISGKLPNIKINKASGTLSLYGSIGMGGSTSLEYVAGTISAGTSRLVCYYNNTLYNNSGGTMTLSKLDWIGSGGTHTVTGKIMVSDTFSTSCTGNCVINGDTLELQGNMVWNNTSSGSGGSVVYKFSGTSAQVFSGTSSALMGKIHLHKTSGDIFLLTALSVSTYLSFESGYIMPDTINWVVFKNGSTAIGASESSFVKGIVKKIGNSSFLFPVGKDTIYHPIGISAPSSTNDAFIGEYINRTQSHDFEKDSLTYLSPCEYWNLQRTAGTSSVKVSLYWDAHTCDIYALTTLRIARWDGSKWNNCGPVTTSGNTSAGSMESNSNLSSFGDFTIGKRTPTLIADAGSDDTIDLGDDIVIGGSPSATGGVAPYSYKWIPSYALSDDEDPNPTAMPFSTFSYYLKVTDLDKSVALDTIVITVNGFDLKTAERFPILTDDSLIVNAPTSVTGAVGVRRHISGSVSATDSVLINTTSSNLGVRHLDTAIQKIDILSANTLSSTLNGLTVDGGMYRVSGNATLNGTFTLQGNSSTYIVIDINGNLAITDNSSIVLDGINWNQVYIRANDVTISDDANLNGIFLLSGGFSGNITDGDVWILAKGKIQGGLTAMKIILKMDKSELVRPIENFFGYNASNVIQEYGYGDDAWKDNITNDKLKALKPDLLRYPGGVDANWWRWQTGWFRGYNNPLYNELSNENNPTVKYRDNYPMPEYCEDGLGWDNNSKEPQENHLLDFQTMINAGASYPIFDLNMVTSDIGTEIGSLFYSHCKGLPIKYIELGNEFYFSSPEKDDLYENGKEYATACNSISQNIKEYFPNVKIGINASRVKGADPLSKENNWNKATNGLEDFLDSPGGPVYFDALTYHIYANLKMKSAYSDCDLDYYYDNYSPEDFSLVMQNVLSTPYLVFDELETKTSPQKEFQLLHDPYDYEGWLTELNQEDDKYNIRGRWAHGLFTSLMAMRCLEDFQITKATVFDLYDASNRDIVFNSDYAFEWDVSNCDPDNDTESKKWGLGAAGRALRLVGMATKNARSAWRISFGGAMPELETAEEGIKKPGVYGWMFTNGIYTSPYSQQDSNWAVILNLSDRGVFVSTGTYFPLGGQYYRLYQNSEYNLNSPLGYITGNDGELVDEVLTLSTSVDAIIFLPKYSITLIRSGNQFVMGTPIVEVSNSEVCAKDNINVYLNCTGATQYHIINGAESIEYDLATTIATLKPTTTTPNFKVYASGPNGNSPWVTIPFQVSTLSSISVSPSISAAPACPGTDIDLDANGSGSLSYNWYPSPNYNTILSSEAIQVNPVEDITYTLNATDKKCYCQSIEVLVNMYDSADAGPDIYVCNSFTENLTMGTPSSYNENTSIQWVKDITNPGPDLSYDDVAQPTVNPYLVNPGIYKYTLTVTYPGEPSCALSDEVYLHVIDCCEGDEGDEVYSPFEDYPSGNYLTTSYLWDNFNSDYKDQYDENCDDDEDEVEYVDAIIDFPNTIIINGLLIVDKDIAFVNCSLKFGADSKVIINPNNRLVVVSSSLDACDDTYMWQGIEVLGNLCENSGLSIVTICDESEDDSYISDAVTAVFSSKDSRLTITDSDFDKNYIHVSLTNYRFAVKNQIGLNRFKKTGSLLAIPYSFSPLQAQYGIYFNRVDLTQKANPNQFYYCNYGLYSTKSWFTAQGNIMENVNIGIFAMDASKDILIDDNQIENCDYGIWVESMNGYTTTISANNPITTKHLNGYGAGIYVSDIGLTDLLIGGDNTSDKNLINSNASDGILLSGFSNGIVKNNVIKLKSAETTSLMYGIRGQDLIGTVFHWNTIGINSGTSNPENKRAMSLTSTTDYEVKCNELDETDFGLQFINTCTANKVSIQGNKLYDHYGSLVLGEDGLSGIQSVISDIGLNGTNGIASGNNFYNTAGGDNNTAPFHLLAINTNAGSVDYNKGIDSFEPDDNPPDNSGKIGTGSAITVSNLDKPSFDCADLPGIVPDDVDMNVAVVNNSLSFSSLNRNLFFFNLKARMFSKLMVNESLLSSHGDYENFFDTVLSNNIGKFGMSRYYVDLSRNSLNYEAVKKKWINLAIDANEEISADYAYEQSHKSIDNIYFNTISKHIYEFNEAQWDTIYETAFKCPYTYGSAVFKARDLFRLKIDTIEFDDRVLCDTSQMKYSDNFKEISNGFRLYPNPSKDYFILQSFKTDSSNLTVFITNVVGTIIDKRKFDTFKQSMLISCEDYSAGLYFCLIKEDDMTVWRSKFIVVK